MSNNESVRIYCMRLSTSCDFLHHTRTSLLQYENWLSSQQLWAATTSHLFCHIAMISHVLWPSILRYPLERWKDIQDLCAGACICPEVARCMLRMICKDWSFHFCHPYPCCLHVYVTFVAVVLLLLPLCDGWYVSRMWWQDSSNADKHMFVWLA